MAVGDYHLRNLQEEDLLLVLDWRNSNRVRENSFQKQIINLEDHYRWFNNNKKNPFFYMWVFESSQEPMGIVTIQIHDQKAKTASWSFYIGMENAPKGLGSKMGYLALEIAFRKLKLENMMGEVLVTNISSIRMHEKLGFLNEGEQIQHEFDIITYSISRNRWVGLEDIIKQEVFK